MIGVDLIADLDSTTGLPTVDDLSTARRWLDAIHGGPENHGATNAFPHFDPVGAGTNQQQVCGSDLRESSNTNMNSNITTKQSTAPTSWNQHAPPIVTLEEIIDEVGVIRDFAHDVANAPEWLDDIWLSSDPDTQSYQLETFIRTCPSASKAVLANFCELVGAANAAVSFCGNLGRIKASVNIPANTGKEKIAEITHEFLRTAQFVAKIGTEAGIVPANH